MKDPTQEELEESIETLTRYRDRLRNEVNSIAKRLRIPKDKVKSSLASHSELKKIESILNRLVEQRSKFLSNIIN